MKVIAVYVGSVFALLMLLAADSAWSLPANDQLLSLVPPGSQIVAGIDAGAVASPHERSRGNFLFFTRANSLDFDDFLSLAGADVSLGINSVIFTDAEGHDGASPEHSLLVSGHFDTNRIYKSASGISITSDYRGVRVIEVRPFERERALLHDGRMLAIINSRVAIFGTVLSAQQEIDRYLNGVAADASIVQWLSQLRNENDTWCLISSLFLGAGISRILTNLDPTLGEIDKNSGVLLFGIRYGRQIEFEYVVDALQNPQEGQGSSATTARLFDPVEGDLSFISSSTASPSRGFRRVVKISKAQYGRWLAQLTSY